MQKHRQALRKAALISPLVLFALFSFALAQKKESDPKQQIVIPASDREITISLKMTDNRVITISQYDGEMMRTGPKGGEVLGITPHVLDDGSVTLDFSRVTRIIRRNAIIGETITSMGSMELNTTLPQSTSIGLISSIQLISISKAAEVSGVRAYSLQQCPCCVTCGGDESCGLSVQLDCGSCRCN